jgi:hypothetical protein
MIQHQQTYLLQEYSLFRFVSGQNFQLLIFEFKESWITDVNGTGNHKKGFMIFNFLSTIIPLHIF